MKGWTKSHDGKRWTRKVGKQLLIVDFFGSGYSADSISQGWNPVHDQILDGDGEWCKAFESARDAAKALIDRERQRAQQILADLEDPE